MKVKNEKRLTPEEIKTIEAYVKGEVETPNATVDYLLDRIRAVKTEGDEVGKQLQELKGMTTTAAQHLTGLNSQYNAYARDLLNWLEKSKEQERAHFTPEERSKLLEIPKAAQK